MSLRTRSRRHAPRGASLRRRLRAEIGSFLVEALVASMVMLIAVIGVIATMGSGLNLVGSSRQRSTAVGVAEQRIEAIHNIHYNQVGLTSLPTHNNDATSPDNAVTSTGCTPSTNGCYNGEALVGATDAPQAAINHLDTTTVGHTTVTIYEYVTWVNDPNVGDSEPSITGTQSYKRVTVVTTWGSVRPGANSSVTESTLIGNGSVVVPASGPTAAPSPTPVPATPLPSVLDILGISQLLSPAPQQQPNPSGPCPTQTQGPTASFSLVSGAGADQGYVNTLSITLNVTANDPCRVNPQGQYDPTGTNDSPPNDITVKLSNCSAPATSPTPTPLPTATPISTILAPTPTPDPCSYATAGKVESGQPTTVGWTILSGDTRKRIYAKFYDADGLVSGTYILDLILDTTRPTVPGSFTKSSCQISGSTRTVNMTWSASTDTNFVGYRYYIKTNSAPSWTALNTTTSLSASDQSKKTDAVQYTVRAYDHAGNESNDPPTPVSSSASKTPC
jgi:hypothetical protein